MTGSLGCKHASNGSAQGGVYETATFLPTSDHTVCFFVYILSVPPGSDYYELWQVNDSINAGFEMVVDNTNTLTLYCDNTIVATADVLNINQWYFMAASLLGVNTALYYKAVGAPTCKSYLSSSGNTFTPSMNMSIALSGLFGTVGGLNGSVCGVKLWSGVALTQAEIEKESEQIDPVRTADLWEYWPLTSDFDLTGKVRGIKMLYGGNQTAASHTEYPSAGPPIPDVIPKKRII